MRIQDVFFNGFVISDAIGLDSGKRSYGLKRL